MITDRTIDLFAGLALSTDEARETILSYSGADRVREWQMVARQAHDHDALCYASVCADDSSPQHIVGRGASPAAALEDLLWQLVGPRLTATDSSEEPR